nr:histone-lysine N-methyltransferase SETD1A-like [Ipomoea batatas]
MSDSDSQNASARDYDEGDEAVSESSSPSTGGSTFNQIDEVEHVSPLAEENEGPTRPTTSTEDVSSSGRGKSPRVVLSKTFPQLSPRNVEQIATTIRQKGVSRELRFGRQNPAPETSSRSRALLAQGEASSSAPDPRPSSASHAPVASSSSDPNPPEADQTASAPLATRKKMVFLNSEVVQQQKCLLTRAETDEIHALLRGRIPYKVSRFPKRTRALTDAAAKIFSEVYDYRVFRTPEGYKSANLEPPDYGREEKYEPVPLAVPTTGDSLAEPSQGMSPDRTFIAPAAAPRPKTKVALGAKKIAVKPAADPPVFNVPDTTPIDTSSGGGAAPDLQVTLGPSRRGKEKRQEAEVEEVLTLKRTKRSASTRSADLHEGLRERDALASSLVDQIRDKVPGMETIMGWSCNRLGEQIAEDILRLTHTTTDLFSRARALEGIREKEVVPLQKQVSATEGRIQELEKELAAAEDRAEKAEKKLGEAEARAERAEKAVKEAIDKMKDASSLARFICTDEAIAKEFLTAFINTEVGDKLTWVYGQLAFSSGCRAIEEQVCSLIMVSISFVLFL